MKIIFLDIDGVICVDFSKRRDEYGNSFKPEYVENLKAIIDKTGAQIVLSSSWRYAGLQIIQEMWEMRNMPGEVIDVTPKWNKHLVCRGEEIAEWLRENEVDSYCIIDDSSDMLPEQMPYFVECCFNNNEPDSFKGMGLIKKCTEKAIEILNKS
jgi:hypothetical protein